VERRMLLAIVLSVVAIFGWQTFFAPKPKPPAAKTPADPSGAPVAVPGDPAGMGDPAMGDPAPVPGMGDPVPAPPTAPAGPALKQQAPHREWTKTLDGEWLDVGLTTRGGAITNVRLRKDFEFAEHDATPQQPIDVILPVDLDLLTGAVTLTEADTERLRTTDWTVVSETADQVVFSFDTTTDLRVVKTLRLPNEAGRYDLEISVAIERLGAPPAKVEAVPVQILGVAGLAREPSNHTSIEEQNRLVLQVLGEHDDPAEGEWNLAEYRLNPVQLKTKDFRLMGVRSHYFLAAIFADGGPKAPLVTRAWGDGGDSRDRDWRGSMDRLANLFESRGRPVAGDTRLGERIEVVAQHFQRAWVEAAVTPAAAGGVAEAATFRIYVGPLSRAAFATDRYKTLHGLITYPFAFDFLARILLWIYDVFHRLTTSAGLAVILMTLVVRGGLMPLSIRNQLSMRSHGRKVSKLKPKLDALKKRFPNDPRRFREEQVKLMREHGVGFPFGCVMMFLQIPIFMALFGSLRIEYALRHEAFGWITDLSGPDRLIDFALTKPLSLIGIPPGGIRGLNVLPILYMGLSIFQQRLMPKPQDPQQAQQMKTARWMSIIFPVLLYNYTAALALYMVVSTIIAILESRVVRAKDLAASNATA